MVRSCINGGKKGTFCNEKGQFCNPKRTENFLVASLYHFLTIFKS